MSKDEFTKLFTYIQEFRNDVDQRLESLEGEVRDTKMSVGELSRQVKAYHEEMIMLTHKVQRLEKWIHEIAEKTGVKLSSY